MQSMQKAVQLTTFCVKSKYKYCVDICCIVDRDNKKSMQLDSIMFNSISNPIQKSNKNNLDVVQLAAMVRVICIQ